MKLEAFPLCIAMCLTACLYPDVMQTYSLTGHFCDSEVHTPFLSGPSCTCGSVGDDASVLFLIFVLVTMLGSCLGVSLGSYLRSLIKHVLSHKNLII